MPSTGSPEPTRWEEQVLGSWLLPPASAVPASGREMMPPLPDAPLVARELEGPPLLPPREDEPMATEEPPEARELAAPPLLELPPAALDAVPVEDTVAAEEAPMAEDAGGAMEELVGTPASGNGWLTP